jgi:hypothetical protein
MQQKGWNSLLWLYQSRMETLILPVHFVQQYMYWYVHTNEQQQRLQQFVILTCWVHLMDMMEVYITLLNLLSFIWFIVHFSIFRYVILMYCFFFILFRNVTFDKPSDQSSRWSSDSNNPPQVCMTRYNTMKARFPKVDSSLAKLN